MEASGKRWVILWNLPNPNTLGTEESVLISEVALILGVEKYANATFGTKDVLIS